MTLDEIRSALAKITPGPWTVSDEYVPNEHNGETLEVFVLGGSKSYPIADVTVGNNVRSNAAFIAAAPEIARFAIEKIEYLEMMVARKQRCIAEEREENEKLRSRLTKASAEERRYKQAVIIVQDTALKLQAERDELRAELAQIRSGTVTWDNTVAELRAEVEMRQAEIDVLRGTCCVVENPSRNRAKKEGRMLRFQCLDEQGDVVYEIDTLAPLRVRELLVDSLDHGIQRLVDRHEGTEIRANKGLISVYTTPLGDE